MKNKCKVEISGIQLTMLSDNSPEEIKSMADALDKKLRELTIDQYHYNKTEAAIICALDFLEENKRLEKALAQLQHQLETQKLDLEILKIENEKLRNKKE